MRNGKEYNPETDTITTTALKYITDYKMAYKYAWRQMAEEAAAPRTVVVKVGAEGAYYPLFSRVEVQHKALPAGIAHAIVKEVTWWGGLLKTIILDSPVQFPHGKRCGVLVHCVDNKGHGVCAVEVAGTGKTDTLQVVSSLRKSADSIPHAGDALSFGMLDIDGGFSAVTRTMKIVGIEPADYGYSLTLKDYNADLYKYGTLPEYKSNITYIPDGNPKPHVSDKGYVTRDELKRVNEQALKQAALEAAAKAAQAAIDTIARGNTFSDAFQLNGYGTSLENLIDKMDKDARNAKDGLSITKDEILLKVSDTEKGLQAYIGITKDQILAKADDMRRELTALLSVQAGAIHALVKGGGAKGQMSLSVNLPVMIDDKTRDKLIKVSSLEKVNAVYAKVKDTDYYGIKGNAGGTAIKLLWEDARRAALLASQIVLEADQIQFKSDNIFVNGKLKADYINVLELAAKNTFIENLVVQKLRIDSDKSSDQDFEAWFDKTNGLKINNNGKEIFRVASDGRMQMGNNIFFKYIPYWIAGRIMCYAFETVKSFCKENGFNTFNVLGTYNGQTFNTIQTTKTERHKIWCLCFNPRGLEPRPFWQEADVTTVEYTLTLYYGDSKIHTAYYKDYPDLPDVAPSLFYWNFEKKGYWSQDINDVYIPQQTDERLDFDAYTGAKETNYVMIIENIPTAKPRGHGIVWKDGDFLKIS